MKLEKTIFILLLAFNCSCGFLKKHETKSSVSSNENIEICKKGWTLHETGNNKEAIIHFDKCIKEGNLSTASLAQTYRNMGLTYNAMKEYKTAIKFYNKSLELKPSDPWSDYINRGNSWDNLGEYKKAFADYNRAIKEKGVCESPNVPKNVISITYSPDCGQIYYNMAISYERQKKMKKARDNLQKAYDFGLRSELLMSRIEVHRELLRRELAKFCTKRDIELYQLKIAVEKSKKNGIPYKDIPANQKPSAACLKVLEKNEINS